MKLLTALIIHCLVESADFFPEQILRSYTCQRHSTTQYT